PSQVEGQSFSSGTVSMSVGGTQAVDVGEQQHSSLDISHSVGSDIQSTAPDLTLTTQEPMEVVPPRRTFQTVHHPGTLITSGATGRKLGTSFSSFEKPEVEVNLSAGPTVKINTGIVHQPSVVLKAQKSAPAIDKFGLPMAIGGSFAFETPPTKTKQVKALFTGKITEEFLPDDQQPDIDFLHPHGIDKKQFFPPQTLLYYFANDNTTFYDVGKSATRFQELQDKTGELGQLEAVEVERIGPLFKTFDYPDAYTTTPPEIVKPQKPGGHEYTLTTVYDSVVDNQSLAHEQTNEQ
ncbi:MAG: hypothetical protein LBS83_01160, partial [Holosporales bacterium]|nr:hypothetical protein [Holosporales bacterium]